MVTIEETNEVRSLLARYRSIIRKSPHPASEARYNKIKNEALMSGALPRKRYAKPTTTDKIKKYVATHLDGVLS